VAEAAEPAEAAGAVRLDRQARHPAIVCEGVHVSYRVYEDPKAGLRQVVARRFRPRESRQINAVRGVDLTVRAGEVLGVVGRNGSGKSTLLRAMAGLLPVTRGAVFVRSQPVMLGVGAVLKPALSGRRNILIGGLALGLTRRQVEERFDEIVEFAGLEESIDLPMRTYSSGMKARLNFAIASAVTPKILLIDEALAVGDREFRDRSRARILELQDAASTTVLVSHSRSDVGTTCSRAIWLDRGQVMMDGDPNDVLEAYESQVRTSRPNKRRA
jgi:teichoic acid transport system ATP-binding protein